jgi:hypothetical protein
MQASKCGKPSLLAVLTSMSDPGPGNKLGSAQTYTGTGLLSLLNSPQTLAVAKLFFIYLYCAIAVLNCNVKMRMPRLKEATFK